MPKDPTTEENAHSTIEQAIQDILAFRDAREWAAFHTPRNLAAGLAVEAAELQETMLWKTDAEVEELLATPAGKRAVQNEIADVLIFSLLLCNEIGVNPTSAIRSKLRENEDKYPVNLAKGRSTKYTNLRDSMEG